MSRARPLASLPGWIPWLLAIALGLQVHCHSSSRAGKAAAADLPAPPSSRALRALSFGEPQFAARMTMLYVQAYDLGGENRLSFAQLDYQRLVGWLDAVLETDPRSSYALFTAARVYAEVTDAAKCRAMLEFLFQAFGRDPDRRWPWLAHAALVAKHRLNDLPRALAYAEAIERHVRDAAAPLWASQMQVFVLEDLNELEAARVLLGGLIANGHARDPKERRFLEARLAALEQRIAAR